MPIHPVTKHFLTGDQWPAFDVKTGAMFVIDDGGQTSVGNLLKLREREVAVWTEAMNKRMADL
jgi:hypothetical protein